MPRKKASQPALGHYRLRSTIVNPAPDGRKKSDWREQAGWPAGTEFLIVEEETFESGDGPGRIVPRLSSLSGFYRLGLEDPRALAILPHLEAQPLKASAWLTIKGGGERFAGSLLDQMVAAGKITIADLDETLNRLRAKRKRRR